MSIRFDGLPTNEYAYLKILDGPLYRDVPEVQEIRDIWAAVEGANSCGEDRLDIRYADFYLYESAPYCNEALTIYERFGERRTVNPEGATYEIWVFGGSTTLDIGAVDAATIPSYLSSHLNDRIPGGIRVRNFGVTGFQSTQERTRFIEILRNEPKAPDIVVFYDGFNEAARSQEPRIGGFPADLHLKISALVEKRHLNSLRFAAGGLVSRSYTFTEVLRPALRALRGGATHSKEGLPQAEIDRRIDLGVENYHHNLRMVRAVAREYGIEAHFFLQPMLFTKPQIGVDEVPHMSQRWVDYWDPIFKAFYGRLQNDERLRQAADFHDLTTVFDAETGNVFRDYGHLVPRGNAIVGEAMAKILAESVVFADSQPETSTPDA